MFHWTVTAPTHYDERQLFLLFEKKFWRLLECENENLSSEFLSFID